MDTEAVITDLGVGEALVSLLDEKGVPGIVGRTLIRPPASRLGPATKAERKAVMAESPVGDIYDEMIDRESAYEQLNEKVEERAKEEAEAKTKEEKDKVKKAKEKAKAKEKTKAKKKTSTRKTSSRRKSASGTVMHEIKLVGRQIIRTEGRRILRGILGSMMRR